MQIHNTPQNYGLVSKTLHWLIGVLIIAVWVVGDYMMEMPDKSPLKYELFDFHKSVGMVILMLVVIRLAWRLYDGAPKFAGMNPVLVTAARTVHYLLYAFMFIQPLSGWAMSSAAGYNPTFFGLFTFPSLVHKSQELAMQMMVVHNTSANLILTLFLMHVAGALFHHFVMKDNTLKRMTIG